MWSVCSVGQNCGGSTDPASTKEALAMLASTGFYEINRCLVFDQHLSSANH